MLKTPTSIFFIFKADAHPKIVNISIINAENFDFFFAKPVVHTKSVSISFNNEEVEVGVFTIEDVESDATLETVQLRK